MRVRYINLLEVWRFPSPLLNEYLDKWEVSVKTTRLIQLQHSLTLIYET